MNTQSDMKARVNTSEESEILENVSETAFRPRHSNPNSFSIQEEGALSEDSPNILETSFRGHQLKVALVLFKFILNFSASFDDPGRS